MKLQCGDEVDARYRVVRHLASGGMSDIYEAEDRNLGRHVALKLVRDPEGAHELAREQLLDEGRTTALVSHANVVHIYEVGSDGRFDYIAMELLEGEPLARKLAREGPLSVAQALRLGVELAVALEAVHDRGFVHGDIKPSNVFLARAGRDGCAVKLLDFGVAMRCGAVRELGSTGGQLVGTLAYMAPEQFRGRWPADVRSDLWAVGVMLYEMLSGRRPFEGDEDASLVFAVATEAPRPLRELRANLPQALCEVVERALHRDVTKRFQSAPELATALRRAGTRRARVGSGRRLEGALLAALGGTSLAVSGGLLRTLPRAGDSAQRADATTSLPAVHGAASSELRRARGGGSGMARAAHAVCERPLNQRASLVAGLMRAQCTAEAEVASSSDLPGEL